MPVPPLVDLRKVDVNRRVMTREQIYQQLPHRYEFMQLDAVIHLDAEEQVAVGLRNVREDEFWVRGHIPGKPLFPGVLMLETAAQLASCLSQLLQPEERFLAFGGLDAVKFRATVTPPAQMLIVEKAVDIRKRRTVCDAQGFVGDQMIFEARITGMPIGE